MTIHKENGDFTILNRSNAAATGGWVDMYAVVGPGLDQIGLQYQSWDDAEAKGRELTETARASLWFEPDASKSAGELVVSFRVPWFRIVRFYPRLSVGPSILFVVGSVQDPIGAAPVTKALAKSQMRKLLVQMHDETPSGYGVQILWCPTIKAYVVTADRGGEASRMTTVDGRELRDVDSQLEFLWELYGDEISEGRYSIDDQLWHGFTAEEQGTIREILGK